MGRNLRSPRHEAIRRLLIERRVRSGLTQDQVAARLKVSQQFISSLEKGARISAVTLLELAEAIGFDPAAFVRAVERSITKEP